MKVYRPETRENIRINSIIYSLPGGGKTRLAGTAQDYEPTSPTMLIDIGGGTLTLSGQKIDIVRPTSLTELQEVYDFLRHDNRKYRSVSLDHLTETQKKLSMGSILEELDADEAGGYGDLTKASPAHLYDWLRSGEHMRKIIRAFADLATLKDRKRRIHVFLMALEKKDDSRSVICPQLPGTLGIECCASVDLVARLYRRKRKIKGKIARLRYLLTDEAVNSEGLTCIARNRGDVLGTGIWEPTVERIVSKWISKGVTE